MRYYKNTIAMLVLLSFFVPSVALAAWWNPLSWFGGWSFFRKDDTSEEVRALKDRISELESSVEDNVVSNLEDEEVVDESDNEVDKEENINESEEGTSAPVSYSQEPVYVAPIVTTPQVETTAKDFTVRCKLPDNEAGWVNTSENVVAELEIWEGQQKGGRDDYYVQWSGGKSKTTDDIDVKEYRTIFNDPGTFNITATVTNIDSQQSAVASCPITVYCGDYGCLSNTGKQKSKLSDIIEEIQDWYTSGDVLYNCAVAESIIRALEYDYSMLGGKNLPSFDKEVDCASTVAPAAYEYKVTQLKNSF